MARTGGYRRSAVWRPCGVTLHAVLQNKSVVCSGSRVTNSTVMKLHGSDNRGGIIVKTYKEHLLTLPNSWNHSRFAWLIDSFRISLIQLLLHMMLRWWAIYMSNRHSLINLQSRCSTCGHCHLGGCPQVNQLKFFGSIHWVWSPTGMERSRSWHEGDLMQDSGIDRIVRMRRLRRKVIQPKS